MELREALAAVIAQTQPVPPTEIPDTPQMRREIGTQRKNYTEKLSHGFTSVLADYLRSLGLPVANPTGPDKQFMGGYATKGVDVYLSDEKHGLLLSSGVKGIPYSVAKNIKNRYRDLAIEALELHKRFPYAVCGHFLFVGRSEALRTISRRRGSVMIQTNVLAEVVRLMLAISGRGRPDDAPELYEGIGILLVEPGDPASLDLRPQGVPEQLWAEAYAERLLAAFEQRNPFYF